MNIFSKDLLMAGEKKCTLTVVTTPSNATCVLTYEGISYNTKSITVPSGTVVNYTINYNSDYNTSSGSWTITEDTTKMVTLEHKSTTLSLTAYNAFDSKKLTATALILNVASDSHTGKTVYCKVQTQSSSSTDYSYSWKVQHPSKGEKTGSGLLSPYTSKSVKVDLQPNGRWLVLTS